MSNITNEQTDLKQLTNIVHSFTFNSKVSNIGDDYLFNKETVMSGLKRKKEPENIVGTVAKRYSWWKIIYQWKNGQFIKLKVSSVILNFSLFANVSY